MQRAYSTFSVRSVNDEQRTFDGIASTPDVLADGITVDPMGAEFKLPMPMMWQHGKGAIKDPVGWITHATPSSDGIAIRGQMAKPKDDYPQPLKDELNGAWVKVRDRLMRGLSIGFSPIDTKTVKIDGKSVLKFARWNWHETSAVAVGMDPNASIASIRSADEAFLRAVTGNDDEGKTKSAANTRPGVPGKSMKGTTMKTFAERLQELQEQRDPKAARVKELSDGCGNDFDTLEEADKTEFRSLCDELKDIDIKIRDVTGAMQAVSGAVAVENVTDAKSGASVRRGVRVEMGKSNLPPGSRFVRAVIAMAAGRGSRADAMQIAKERWRDTPEVVDYIRDAAVGTGANDATTGNWADPLNVRRIIDSEFVELLRPQTILGRIQGLRSAQFNTQIVVQTGGSTVNWVGNAKAKPVGELSFDFLNIDIAKCAGIVVLSEEQIMTSRPGSEAIVSQDLVSQVAQFLDQQLLDPNVAGTDDNPASLTNNVSPIPASGPTANDLRVDLMTALETFTGANMGVGGLTLVTNSNVAMGIALLTNALGQPEFGSVNMTGGTLMGMQLIVSDNVPTDTGGALLVLLKPSEIYVADAGGVRVDTSREATLDMGGGNTPDFNLWQKNCVAFRAERFISWKKRRANAVTWISGAAYAPAPAV